MSAIAAVTGTQVITNQAANQSIQVPKSNQPSFKDAMHKVGLKEIQSQVLGQDLHKDIIAVQRSLESGRSMPMQDLVLYQIKAGQFNLRVELISKMGESVMSTLRKFQQGQ